MFLWNFCHLFPVLFYDWNKSITDSFWFFRGFSRNHFLEGCFTFQCGRDCFSDREALFLSECKGGRGGGVPHEEHWFWCRGFQKIVGWKRAPSPLPIMENPEMKTSSENFIFSIMLLHQTKWGGKGAPHYGKPYLLISAGINTFSPILKVLLYQEIQI